MAAFTGNNDTLFAERMLEHGYFPENIPPVFAITNLHEAAIKPLKSGEYITDKPTEGCRYNVVGFHAELSRFFHREVSHL
ncbi:hypothetical protein F4V91_29560 [Neorhizobium galegae]|uniref:Uncharacterized protein n=1 Tax=Neorhizobium galegae TaxID=399 RepID=A0A6A1TK37_NEOGA|nr:hypothetical protein [Neorhizobium galegae]KAB1083628.1 hypothetical protein F4V91_29560 [Neorhizobium galegae]